ncbi:MAG: hypothetical protein ABIB46_06460 [bacterium]
MKILQFFLVIFLSTNFLYSAPFNKGGLIDIPTANILEHTFVNVYYGMQFWTGQGDWSNSFDKTRNEIDLGVRFGLFDRAEIGISILTKTEACLNLNAKLLQEKEMYPSISIGIQNISSNSDISSYGIVQPKSIYAYHTIYPHSQNNSLFIVFSKKLIDMYNTQIHIGKGSGRFIGESTISSKFYGFFGGIQMDPFPNLCLKIEVNGRDMNIGLEYSLEEIYLPKNFRFVNDFTVGIACNMFEDLIRKETLAASPYKQPKFGFALNYTMGPIFEPIIPPIKKEELIEKISPKEEELTTLEEELLEIRNKRKNIEGDINNLKQKLEKIEKEGKKE